MVGGFTDSDVDVEDQDEEGAEFNRKVGNCSASALGGWGDALSGLSGTFEPSSPSNGVVKPIKSNFIWSVFISALA